MMIKASQKHCSDARNGIWQGTPGAQQSLRQLICNEKDT